jgi:propanediol dehydratase small subunit
LPEYPLIEESPEELRTPTGRPLAEITLDAVLAGEVGMEDLSVSSDALELQAQIAAEANRPQLAENLRRAAELVNVPEEKILEVYTALRPGRATPARLLAIADELEREYNTPLCAAFIREAAAQ